MTDGLALGVIWHEQKAGLDLRSDRWLEAWIYLSRAKAGLIFGMTDGLELGFIWHEQKAILPAYCAEF